MTVAITLLIFAGKHIFAFYTSLYTFIWHVITSSLRFFLSNFVRVYVISNLIKKWFRTTYRKDFIYVIKRIGMLIKIHIGVFIKTCLGLAGKRM